MSGMVEQDVRDYLRGVPSLMALLNGENDRLNIDYRGNPKATHITLYRAGGGFDDYLPHENPVVTLHCYGTTRSVAAGLAQAVAGALRAITQANDPLRSASVESINFEPTPDGTARYVVISLVTARLVQAA